MEKMKIDEEVSSDEIITGVYTGIKPACRLSATTRKLAAYYLSGEFGRSIENAKFAISKEFYLSIPSPNQQYAEAVRLIAGNAPLRIVAGEKLVGAATRSGRP